MTKKIKLNKTAKVSRPAMFSVNDYKIVLNKFRILIHNLT